MPQPTTPVESAPWPVPDGTLLEPESWGLLGNLMAGADRLRFVVGDFLSLDNRPVKRHPTHDVYVHDLAAMIDTLEKIQEAVQEARGALDAAFCQAVPFQTSSVTYADTRPLVPRFGGERVKWENELLREDVYPLVVMDPEEEGVFRHPESVREACFSVVSLNGSNVKVTGLRALGLDPDDYCHKVPKAAVVQVVK